MVHPDDLHLFLTSTIGPDLQLLKAQHREDFNSAFGHATRSLTQRERNVLRLYVFGGFSIDQIGASYGVHRASAARWIAATKEKLLTGTREALKQRLKLSDSEAGSLIQGLCSQLEVSLRSLL
jgi:RNA polymerase sigma-70 factor (ECF subfamily)